MKSSKFLVLSTLIAAAAAAFALPAAASTALSLSLTESDYIIISDEDSDGTDDTLTVAFDMSGYDEVSSRSEGQTMTGGTYYYFNSTNAYNLVIGTSSTTGVAITDGNSGTATISGSVSGEGVIAFYQVSSSTSTFAFTGDMSEFSGTIYVDNVSGSSNRLSVLTFSGTSTEAVSGTGTIISDYNINYTVSSGDVTVANSSIALDGTLTFSGANYTLTGAISGNDAGTLTSSTSLTIEGSVSDFATLTSTGSITVSDSGTLDLSGTTVSLSEAIANSGTVTVDSSTVIDLTDALLSSDDDATYIVISGEGTISGWDSDTLTYANFSIDGAALNSHADVEVSAEGSVTLITASLTWNSSDGAAWSDSDVWTLSKDDSSTSFLENDVVIFDGTATGTATVSSDVTATSVTVTDSASQTISVDSGVTLTTTSLTVDEGSTLTIDGEGTVSVTTLEISGTVSVGEDVTLDLTGTTLDSIESDISGAGTVSLALTTDYNATIDLGDNFEGTTYITSGYFTLSSDTNYGSTIKLADATRIQIAGSSTVDFDGTITAESASRIYTNSGSTLTFTSDSTLNGTRVDKYGAGTMVFDGNTVNLTTFSVTDGNGTVTFNADGTYSFTTFTVSNGTLNLNGATITAKTLTISGTEKYLYLSDDVTFDVSGSGTISKNIYDGDTAGSLTMSGEGTLTISGTNTYSGGTTVSAGTLVTSNSSALGTGAVTISGGTLQASSDLAISDALTIDGGSLLVDSEVTLTVSSIEIVLSDAYLTSTTTSDDSSSTSSAAKSSTILLTSVADDDSGTTTVYAIDGEGTLSVEEIIISFDEDLANEIAALSTDATYTFSLAASAISGVDDVTITLDGLDTSSWTASLSDGTLTLTYTIPEPGSFGLIAGTLALAFAASRRRRSRKA